MSGTIPTNWKMLALSQIAEIRLGKMLSAKAREDGLLQRPYLRNENVRWGTVDLSDLKVMGFKPEEIERYSVHPGDLVICEGGEAGRCAVYRGSESVMYQKAIHRLRPSPGVVMPEFLQAAFEYGIKSKLWFPRFSETTIQHLPLEKITAVEIPIPPPKEQDRIVAALDERLSELDASVASLERAERNLIRYRAAVLAAACSGKLVTTEADLARRAGRSYEPADQLLARILTERRKANIKAKYEEPAQPDTSNLPKLPDGWAWATVEQVANPTRALTYGVVLLGKHEENGIPVLRSSNVRSLWLELDNVKRCAKQITDQFSRTYLQGGELLVTVRGTLGGVVVAPDSLRGVNVSREVAVIPPMRKELMGYLALCLASPQGRRRLAKEVKGNTYQGVNIEDLRIMPFALPPLIEQERIVAEVDRHLTRADALAASVAQAKRRAQRLRRAILAAAFEGRLVPQDPNDEPASVLLDRIRAQTPQAVAAPHRKRPPALARVAETTATYDAPAPRRRGRPSGSKNKAKA